MGELSADEFAQRAFGVDLLTERQVEALWAELGTQAVTLDQMIQLAVRRELLTNYHVERLIRGDQAGYFYGEYKSLYLIGTGTFARVYRAAHRKTGDVKAIKVLRKRFSENKDQRDQFLREGNMGIALQHPNIVPIASVHSQEPYHYLVMDFVEGRNLREFLKVRQKLAPEEAVRLLIDLLEGLSYAFDLGVTHRDLKLSNALVSSRGQAQLVDFGLAVAVGLITDDNLEKIPNPRTIDYAGLERASGVRKDDVRSDIYFLGGMFYHMLSGEAPLFETKERTQRLSVSRYKEIIPILQHEPTLPPYLAAIVGRALELSPERRYQSPQEMLQDVKAAATKLAAGDVDQGEDEEVTTDASMDIGVPAEKSRLEGESRTVMVVETSVTLQNALRNGLKKRGYRVLVIGDPDRALERFKDEDMLEEEQLPANCVIFGTSGLGESALEAFNRFGEEPETRDIPALLLLGEPHQQWQEQANLADHRVVLSIPVKLGQVRMAIFKMLNTVSPKS